MDVSAAHRKLFKCQYALNASSLGPVIGAYILTKAPPADMKASIDAGVQTWLMIFPSNDASWGMLFPAHDILHI